MDLKRLRPAWKLSAASTVVLLVLVGLVELWAMSAADPDFFLPDPFRPLVLYVVVLWLVAGFVPWPLVRFNVRFGLGVLVVLGLLGMEVYLRGRDAGIAGERIQQSDDVLLRYHYRPGVAITDADTSGRTPRVNSLGLWDEERAIPKPEGVYRIVLLGDSVPNDQTLAFVERFPRRLQELLAQDRALAGGKRIEVVNASCEGYSTLQEVRLLERVGLRYQPDLVVVAYVLNDPFLQNGGYRRVGNSFFAFRFAALLDGVAAGGSRSVCNGLSFLYDRYSFDLMVREPLEKLKLLSQVHGFPVAVGLVPVVAPFDDPACDALYDQVAGVTRGLGFSTLRLVDEFRGTRPEQFENVRNPGDVFHPNAAAHARIAAGLARGLRPLLVADAAAGP